MKIMAHAYPLCSYLRLLKAVCAVLALVLAASGVPGQIVINELLASNYRSLSDGEERYNDWIELHNAGASAVDVGGMYLTDQLGEPARGRISDDAPAQTTIAPGGHLVLWAADWMPPGSLYVGFSLSIDGEEVALYDRDGVTLLDHVVFGPQRTDVSYGRAPDGSETWRFFETPTPGVANGVTGFENIVGDVRFSAKRGMFTDPFAVTLACDTADAAIFYTLDASTPGAHSTPYSGPIAIDQTTCLRAVALRDGWLPSYIDTQTYIFPHQTIHQTRPDGYPQYWASGLAGDYEMDPELYNHPDYVDQWLESLLALPVISIVTDRGHLFDSRTGIYMNPRSEGVLWERPTSAEMFGGDGEREFQINCGLRIQGGASRTPSNSPKHSFRLLFKGIYGDTKLNHRLFGRGTKDAFDTLVLRAGYNNTWIHWDPTQRLQSQYMRDQWARDSQLAMGQVSAHGDYAHLFVNGLYWGVYNLTERPQASFAAYYYGGEKEEWDALNSGVPVDGDTTAWDLAHSIANAGVSDATGYFALADYVDIPNLIDYILLNFYGDNSDWDDHNWYAARRRTPGSTFKFFMWDSERYLEREHTSFAMAQNRAGKPSRLHRQLAQNPEYRLQFADHVHRHLFNDGVLTPEKAVERWDALSELVRLPLISESIRWGDYRRDVHSASNGPYLLYTVNEHWAPENERIRTQYFPQRRDRVISQLRGANLYPQTNAPTITPWGGQALEGDLVTLGNPNTGGILYYTTDGKDPRVAFAGSGHVNQEVLVPENGPKTVLVPTGEVSILWRVDAEFDDSGWASGSGGVGYDTRPEFRPFIQIDVQEAMYQKHTTCLIRSEYELSGIARGDIQALTLRMRYDDGFVAYLNGVLVAQSNAPATPAWDSSATQQNPDTAAVQFQNFSLTAHIGRLLEGSPNLLAIHGLNDNVGSTDFLISYELVASVGTPDTELCASAQVYDGPITLADSVHLKARVLNGTEWSALSEVSFSVGSPARDLRITEIMYNPAEPTPGTPFNKEAYEFLELMNLGANTLDLSQVSFTNGITFGFAPQTLVAPGQRIVLAANLEAYALRYPDSPVPVGQYSGQLSNSGERLRYVAGDQVVQDFTYSDARGWPLAPDGSGHSLVPRPWALDRASQGALDYGGAWTWGAHILGSPGVAEPPRRADVVLNEIMAHTHADEPPYTSNNWIELVNTSDTAVTLRDYFLSNDGRWLDKWAIPEITIPAGGFVTFDEITGFYNPIAEGFGLSAAGGEVFLSCLPGDRTNRVVDYGRFLAQEPQVALGRFPDGGPWREMLPPSRNGANQPPLARPVISEMMYNPPAPAEAPEDDTILEYVEILNPTNQPIALESDAGPWRIEDGIRFVFPAGTVLGPGQTVLVVNFNPEILDSKRIFLDHYGLDEAAVTLMGAFGGNLSNKGERVALEKPVILDATSGEVGWAIVDEVIYFDAYPWPPEADGDGAALHRLDVTRSGNDPENWEAAPPAPGRAPGFEPAPSRAGWFLF